MDTPESLRRLSCSLLQARYPEVHPVPAIYNPSYAYWKNFWNEWVRKNQGTKSESYLHVENFFRHDLIISLHIDELVIGMMCSSFLNLSAIPTFDHPYFGSFPPPVLQELKSLGRGLAITGEYLSVHSDFRKSATGVSFSEVLIGLLLKAFQSVGGTHALGTGLKEVKVPDSCKKFGYQEVGTLLKCNLECSILINTPNTLQEHPDPHTANWIDRLWSQRTDFTHGLFTNVKNQPVQKVA